MTKVKTISPKSKGKKSHSTEKTIPYSELVKQKNYFEEIIAQKDQNIAELYLSLRNENKNCMEYKDLAVSYSRLYSEIDTQYYKHYERFLEHWNWFYERFKRLDKEVSNLSGIYNHGKVEQIIKDLRVVNKRLETSKDECNEAIKLTSEAIRKKAHVPAIIDSIPTKPMKGGENE